MAAHRKAGTRAPQMGGGGKCCSMCEPEPELAVQHNKHQVAHSTGGTADYRKGSDSLSGCGFRQACKHGMPFCTQTPAGKHLGGWWLPCCAAADQFLLFPSPAVLLRISLVRPPSRSHRVRLHGLFCRPEARMLRGTHRHVLKHLVLCEHVRVDTAGEERDACAAQQAARRLAHDAGAGGRGVEGWLQRMRRTASGTQSRLTCVKCGLPLAPLDPVTVCSCHTPL
eukprot:364327-Chlamydomonas_euryale.AAC.5